MVLSGAVTLTTQMWLGLFNFGGIKRLYPSGPERRPGLRGELASLCLGLNYLVVIEFSLLSFVVDVDKSLGTGRDVF